MIGEPSTEELVQMIRRGAGRDMLIVVLVGVRIGRGSLENKVGYGEGLFYIHSK